MATSTIRQPHVPPPRAPGTSAAAAATAEAPAPLGGLRGCAALSAGAAFPEPAAVLGALFGQGGRG
eukprot:7627460-Pyramimonas_sp.AAC.1